MLAQRLVPKRIAVGDEASGLDGQCIYQEESGVDGPEGGAEGGGDAAEGGAESEET